MAYDEGLAERVRGLLQGRPGVETRAMFGGLGFLLHGNMAVGIMGRDLVVRVGPEAYETALTSTHARPFDFTGRPMRGWVLVEAQGIAEDEDLAEWVGRGVAFAETLPPK